MLLYVSPVLNGNYVCKVNGQLAFSSFERVIESVLYLLFSDYTVLILSVIE